MITKLNQKIELIRICIDLGLKRRHRTVFIQSCAKTGQRLNGPLSEGETTFLTFLYFLLMLEGGQSPDHIGTQQVVVIDDPISSLDDEILFIVSSLIRSLYPQLQKQNGSTTQLFVSTHNVRFFREVSKFRGPNSTWPDQFVAHYVLRKRHEGSVIKRFAAKNPPIKSAYEQLWDEVRSPNPSLLTLPNTMRRILEYYVVDLCGIKLGEISLEFEGDERVICSSLISWANAGSHRVEDQVLLELDEQEVARFKKVFEAIFEKVGHQSHYDLMIDKF